MSNDNAAAENLIEYVTVMIGGQLFGLPISRVQDVFVPDRLTRVPLAPPEVAGVLNLRGRIVTTIDMRRRLGLPPRNDNKPSMAVGIELRGEHYDARAEPGQSRSAARARVWRRSSPRRTADGHSRRGLRAQWLGGNAGRIGTVRAADRNAGTLNATRW
jgi:hypothetical protein